jgi:hypothetical protein
MTAHTLVEYIQLIRSFVNGKISGSTFEKAYLRMFKEDPTIRPDAEYNVLNELFSDVDVYCPDAEIRPSGGLDEEGLRSKASRALSALNELTRTN